MIIALTGFPGSGKSSIGQYLAKHTGFSFLDTDAEIEKTFGISAAEIIRREGEAVFRRKEAEILRKILDKPGNLILSLGGGMILLQENLKLLQEKTLLVFIHTPFERIVTRLVENPGDRPLLSVQNDTLDITFLKDLYLKRLPRYREARLEFFNDFPDAQTAALHLLNKLQLPEK